MGKIVKCIKKKGIAAGMAGAMALACFTPAWAHGHHYQRTQAATQAETQCPVCTIDGCDEAGRHYHDGTVYCGYGHASGYCDGTCYGTASHHGCHR